MIERLLRLRLRLLRRCVNCGRPIRRARFGSAFTHTDGRFSPGGLRCRYGGKTEAKRA